LDGSYNGHDFEDILGLYPTIRVFCSEDVTIDETWRIFFLLCLSEARNAETWIDSSFADTLQGMAELPLLNVPYQTLCRSIFDTDPAAMFLALYRCLEALYAFSSARKLIGALSLSDDWAIVATALEDALGWHPREENSLMELVEYATEPDHRAIFSALAETVPETSGDLAGSAARRIYKLRNDLVHYRPAQHEMNFTTIDWNRLCEATAAIVCFIYAEVFKAGAATGIPIEGRGSEGGQ
jgi:hypothetical protein